MSVRSAIQFTPREPHPLAGVGAAAIPEFSSSVSAIAAATCVRKKADSSSRVLPTRASESIGFHRNLCKSQRLPTFSWQPAAKSANDCSTANSSLPATYNICSGDWQSTGRSLCCLMRENFKDSTGFPQVLEQELWSGAANLFAPEQPPTIPGAVQLRLPSTRTVWNSSGRPCEWCRLARCAACG